MFKGLIVYFSQGGTTARVAESIAAGLRKEGYEIDLCNMKDKRPPDLSEYELFGIGYPVYYFRPPFNVTDYVNSLPDLAGLQAFVFVLHGTYQGDASNPIRRTLTRKGAREVGYFHCLGADFYLSYLKEGYLFSPDHPTKEELARAEAFGHQVAGYAVGKPYILHEKEPPPPMVYHLERFLMSRWLVRQMYSRQFRVDAEKCTGCGLCIKLCPTRNITDRASGHPAWGRDCLLCLTCEMKCPEDAITSSAGSLFSRLLVIPHLCILHNIRHASSDPSLDYVRVVHRHGRTKREDQS